MIHMHKYKTIAESNGWLIERCVKCNKERETQKISGGYQPKPKEKE